MSQGQNTGDATDLVMGLALGYCWTDLRSFVSTLAVCAPSARVHLLTDAEGAKALTASKTPNLTYDDVSAFIASAAALGVPYEVARYALYRDHLAQTRGLWRRVLLSDTRDVFFQADPFAHPALAAPFDDVLIAALEDTTFAACTINARWITQIYGADALQALANTLVLCSGTTIGSAARIEAYAAALCDEFGAIPRARFADLCGIDQGLHNALVRRTGATYLANHDLVSTLHHTHRDRIVWRDKVLCVDDRPPAAIVHQYDRHPTMAARLAEHLDALEIAQIYDGGPSLCVRSYHKTSLAFVEGHLIHRRQVGADGGFAAAIAIAKERGDIDLEGFDDIEFVALGSVDFALRRNGKYASAVPDVGTIVFDRTVIQGWETFQLCKENKALATGGRPVIEIEIAEVVEAPDGVLDTFQFEENFTPPLAIDASQRELYDEAPTQFFPVRSGRHTASNGIVMVEDKFLAIRFESHGSVFDQRGFYNNAHFVFRSSSDFRQVEVSFPALRFLTDAWTTYDVIEGTYLLPFDGNSSNYYHFIVDGLVHMSMMRRRGFDAPPIMFTSRHGPKPWQEDLFALCDMPSMLLLNGDCREIVRVSKMIWIEKTGLCDIPRDEVTTVRNVIRAAAGATSRQRCRRLFIERKSIRRSILNQEEVGGYLARFGFEAVELEGMPVAVQVRMFAQAEIVVGAHGAGLVNIMFCNPGAIVVDILPAVGSVAKFFWLLAEKVGVAYRFIRASSGDHNSPMHVDLSQLALILRDVVD